MDNKDTIFTSLWLDPNDDRCVKIIDQRGLPFRYKIESIKTLEQMVIAIRDMHLRGAPLIGVAAAFGLYLGILEAENSQNPEVQIQNAYKMLLETRPTAVNLKFGLDTIMKNISRGNSLSQKENIALQTAVKFRQNEIDNCLHIGIHGARVIRDLFEKTNKTVNILTHCNAGWLACIQHGTATAPIYQAHKEKIPVHVWVDETRPRNQGARLTAWELEQAGVPYTLIADNAGGHLMQEGQVDLVIVGSDRTTSKGDVYNKIGTYLKALAAKDNGIPFYVALPFSTIDFEDEDRIKIEIRSDDEIHFIQGEDNTGKLAKIRISPHKAKGLNHAFDCTPRSFVSGLITEYGISKADGSDIQKLKEQSNG